MYNPEVYHCVEFLEFKNERKVERSVSLWLFFSAFVD